MQPKHLLALTVLTLCMPAASAQMVLPGPSLVIHDIELPSEVDAGLVSFNVTGELQCAMDYPDPTAAYDVELSMVADDRNVTFSGLGNEVISQACFNLAPTSSSYALLWEVTMDASNISTSQNLQMEAVLEGRNVGGNPTYADPADAHKTQVTTVHAQNMSEDPAKAPPIPEEQTTPGPALGLVVAGLAVIAMRRR